MALWRTLTFKSLIDATIYLNGAIVGTVNIHGGALVDGLTFIANNGGADRTVTFPARGRAHTPAEIVASIAAGHADINASPYLYAQNDIAPKAVDRRLMLYQDTPTITVTAAGTANALLGLAGPLTQTITPDTGIAGRIYRNIDGQDTWTVIAYS